MKITHVINNLATGGAEKLTIQLALEAASQGHEVRIVTLNGVTSELRNRLCGSSVKVVTLERSVSKWAMYRPSTVLRLAMEFRQNEPDVIHSHLFPAQPFCVVAAALARSRAALVTTEHNTYNRRQGNLLAWIDRLWYRQYQRIICISDAVLEKMRLSAPQSVPRAVVVSNGIEFPDTSVHVEAAQLTGPSVLTIGRCALQKGQERLVRALPHCPGVHLYVIGDGELRPKLERLAEELGVAERVRFLGVIADVSRYLYAADVYVQPSLFDGFCLATVEALAHGRPVIVSNVPGLADVVEDAAVKVDASNPAVLAEAICNLLKSPAQREELARRGKARARQFDVRQTAQAYLSVYRGLNAPPSGAC